MQAGPCKGCDERRPGCHAACAAYLEVRAECDRRIAARVREQMVTDASMALAARHTHKSGRGYRTDNKMPRQRIAAGAEEQVICARDR